METKINSLKKKGEKGNVLSNSAMISSKINFYQFFNIFLEFLQFCWILNKNFFFVQLRDDF